MGFWRLEWRMCWHCFLHTYHDAILLSWAALSQAQQFVPIIPCRLMDTRLTGGPIPGGTYRTFNLPQLAQSEGVGRCSRGQATDRIVLSHQMRSKRLIDLDGRAAQNTELVALEGGGETGICRSKDTSRGEKLERNPPFQEGRPFNAHRHRRSHVEFVLGNHQNSATAQIDGHAET